MRSEEEIKKMIEKVKEREKYARKDARMRISFDDGWYHEVIETEANRMAYLRRILEWVLDDRLKLF